MQAVLLITGAALWCSTLMLLNRDVSTPVKEQVRRALREWRVHFVAYCALKWKVGFTLIELAIVLVIIGLIVGGVLVGRDLIKASEIRAEISQIEKFNAAANAFRDKYNCLPGDCANATDFFPSSAIAVAWGANGNGNGVLDDVVYDSIPDSTGFPFTMLTEPSLFWSHLYAAGLTECCNGAAHIGDSVFTIGMQIPQDKVNGFGIGVGTLGGRNGYFWGITVSTGGPGWVNNCGGNPYFYADLSCPFTSGVITPAQALAIDTKIDDGQPSTGNVYAAWVSGGDAHVHALGYYPTDLCTLNTTPVTYNVAYGSVACNLWINMQGM